MLWPKVLLCYMPIGCIIIFALLLNVIKNMQGAQLTEENQQLKEKVVANFDFAHFPPQILLLKLHN